MADGKEINPEEILESIQKKMGGNPAWQYDVDLTRWTGMSEDEIIAEIFGETVEQVRESNEEFAKANPMWRRVKYPNEYLASYHRWLEGDNQTEILDFLNNAVWADDGTRKYEDVGLRTVTRWLSYFRELPKEEVEQDKNTIWYHKLDQYNIPWDKYSELVQGYGTQLTPRRAKWVLRLKQLQYGGRSLPPEQVMRYTNEFVQGEQEQLIGLSHNLFGTSLHLQSRFLNELTGGQQ